MTLPRFVHGFSMLLPILALAGGCANYRYDVVGRDESALAVTKDRDLVLPAAPANLRFRQVESRCVLLIENPTTQPISLDGANSAVVDPKGESRAVASQLIAPGSFTKLILPPNDERPRNDSGFQFGIGVLVNADTLPESRPAQLLQVNGPKQEYWKWSGPGEIRVILSLRQNEQTSRQEILLRRTKP